MVRHLAAMLLQEVTTLDLQTQPAGLIDTTELKQKCRKQEDRLRRLGIGAIEAVIAKPSRVDREYANGLTYDGKIQGTLRKVFEKCPKARKACVREFEAAEEKWEKKKMTEDRLEAGRRRRQ